MASPQAPDQTVGVTRARQARLGRPVLWVLLISTVLAALALLGAWLWRADDLASSEPHNARQAHDAAVFDTEPPPPAQ